MKKNLKLSLLLSLIIIVSACSNDGEESNASEETLEGSNIEFIVPQAAGGGTDTIARSLAKIAEDELDASIGVVNKEGGGGAVGMAEGAAANPDGKTVTFATVELSFLNHLGLSDVSPDDFESVAQVNLDPGAITVEADAPYDTVEEFVEYAKEHPGEIKIGGSGFGAIWHLAAEQFAEENDIDIEFIPFDGAGPSVTSLLGGHIDAVTVSPGEVLSQVESEELKMLAVMDDESSDAFPDVPTLEEADVESTEVGAWRGVVVPNDTPDEIVEELEEAFTTAAESDEFAEFMEENGMGIEIKNSEEFSEQMEETSEMFEPLINELDIDKEDLDD